MASVLTSASRDSRQHDPQYCLNQLPLSNAIKNAIARIAEGYQRDSDPWIVGFSGGKDSSCLLKLLFHALRQVHDYHKPITIVYCDTGVEIPLAVTLARRTLDQYRVEASHEGLPVSTRVLTPRIRDRFFVKVIGRGYPPPTDKFRWCTDRLRIQPITQLMAEASYASAVVLIGVRQDESATRAATLNQHKTRDRYWRIQSKTNRRRLFVPILDFNVIDVWQSLLLLSTPSSVNGKSVADLYADAAGECPTIREPNAAPCGKARFGCWTCTVAKHGTTLKNLIEAGRTELAPLLEFRLWLDKYRYDSRYRWRNRRNGQPGLGPMTMRWRRMALNRLLRAQEYSRLSLISSEELNAIQSEWSRE
jgi:DNA sulfur modification protein DndC